VRPRERVRGVLLRPYCRHRNEQDLGSRGAGLLLLMIGGRVKGEGTLRGKNSGFSLMCCIHTAVVWFVSTRSGL